MPLKKRGRSHTLIMNDAKENAGKVYILSQGFVKEGRYSIRSISTPEKAIAELKKLYDEMHTHWEGMVTNHVLCPGMDGIYLQACEVSYNNGRKWQGFVFELITDSGVEK